MESKDAKQVLGRYQEGSATEEEIAFVENWILYGAHDGTDLTDEELRQDLIAIRQRLHIDKPQTKTIRLLPRLPAIAAAAILIIIATGSYFLLHKPYSEQLVTQNNIHHDIAPGRYKAVLTLADGRQIGLTNAKDGILARQGNTTINKIASGEIIYHVNDSHTTAAAIAYNTVTIPRAGKWNVVLPDGSKAWLDAFSSIRFPTEFTGKHRTVEITGQVYFEVIHNAAHPFRVAVKGQMVEDIGTHFNINAYTDEPVVKTTLLEGSVRVSKGIEKVILKPGQQSVISNKNKILVKTDLDTEDDIAWKEGYFAFKKASIQTVMRQFSRWYDVDVAYEGKTPITMITGKVSRDVNASEALKIISDLGVNFRIENKKIIITP